MQQNNLIPLRKSLSISQLLEIEKWMHSLWPITVQQKALGRFFVIPFIKDFVLYPLSNVILGTRRFGAFLFGPLVFCAIVANCVPFTFCPEGILPTWYYVKCILSNFLLFCLITIRVGFWPQVVGWSWMPAASLQFSPHPASTLSSCVSPITISIR